MQILASKILGQGLTNATSTHSDIVLPIATRHATRCVCDGSNSACGCFLFGGTLAIQARSGPERFAGREPEQGRYRCFSWRVFSPPGLCARTRHFSAQSESWDNTADHCGKTK